MHTCSYTRTYTLGTQADKFKIQALSPLSLIHTQPPSTSAHYLFVICLPLSGIILIPLFSHLLSIGAQNGYVFNKQLWFTVFLRRLLTHLACHSIMNKQWRSGALFSFSLFPPSLLSCPAMLWTECQDCLENELSVEGLQWDTSGSLWALENNELFPFLALICSIRYPWQEQRDKQSPLELIKYAGYIQKSFCRMRVQGIPL